MTPAFFLLICLGGIVCLTPLAVYLVWLSALNRKPRPTVVSASWDFVATVCGLIGFLFGIGVLLSSAVTDLGLFTRGPFNRLAQWLPWLNLAWFVTLTLYVLFVVRAIRLGIGRRRDSLSIFNIDEPVLQTALDEALLLIGRDGERSLADIQSFPVFRHSTVRLINLDPSLRNNLEQQLRLIVPRQPAAADNPAAPWISAATTCTIICVGCCAVLIFALPFLK